MDEWVGPRQMNKERIFGDVSRRAGGKSGSWLMVLLLHELVGAHALGADKQINRHNSNKGLEKLPQKSREARTANIHQHLQRPQH